MGAYLDVVETLGLIRNIMAPYLDFV